MEEVGGLHKAVGQPTEAALRVVADKIMASTAGAAPFNAAIDYFGPKHAKQAVLEFDRDRKSMSVIVNEPDAPGQIGRASCRERV